MSFVRNFIDTLLPPSKEGLLIREETTDSVERLYLPHRHKQHEAICGYTHPTVKALIHANKFQANSQAHTLLAHLLLKRLAFCNEPIVVVPIPLSFSRHRERGYNQVLAITKKLPSQVNDHPIIISNALQRTRDTTPQVSLKKKEREDNMKNVFTTTTAAQRIPHDSLVIILDDVVTTGATLTAAYTALHNTLPRSTVIKTMAIAH